MRETVTLYKSDISGEDIGENETAVEVRIRYPDGDKNPIVLDAKESEVKDLISKGREEKQRGRKPSK